MYCILVKSTPFFIVLYFALCEGSASLLNSVDLTIIPSKKWTDKGCRLSGCHIFFRLILCIFVLIILNYMKRQWSGTNTGGWGGGTFCFVSIWFSWQVLLLIAGLPKAILLKPLFFLVFIDHTKRVFGKKKKQESQRALTRWLIFFKIHRPVYILYWSHQKTI